MAKKTRMNVLIVTMLILCAALSMGCVDEPLDTPASVFIEKPEVELYDDEAYIKDVSKYINKILPVVEDGAIHSSNGYYSLMENDGKMMQTIASNTLIHLGQHTISSKLQPFANEFEASVKDMYQSGVYLESGAHNGDAQDITMAATYMGKSTEHLEMAFELIPDNM